jgi:taurine transport system substrate-binding protein
MNVFKQLSIVAVTLFMSTMVLADDVTIGYQTGIEPAKIAIADGEYEKATGQKINWRRFDNGAELIRAMASGDVDIGNVGSSIVATAATRNLPIETFLIAAQLGTSEALVVRKDSGIKGAEGWEGKVIAVPFVSTSHYSLLSTLKHWGVDLKKVKIINLRVSEIAAAWTRGDIDAAYVWEPGLGKIKENGNVLATSADVAQWGAPTFDLWISRKAFAEKNPEFLTKFSQVSLAHYQQYQADPVRFIASQSNLDKIAKVTGAKTDDIKSLLGGDTYPLATNQEQLLSGAVSKAIADTALFLKGQGQLDKVLPDYSGFVTGRFISLTGSGS